MRQKNQNFPNVDFNTHPRPAIRAGTEEKYMKNAIFIMTGTRRVAGTVYPIETKIERDGKSRKPWLVTFSICNGVGGSTARYRTKREALAAVQN